MFESELPSRESDKLRFEVFDDDGKHGRDTSDESIGVGYFTVAELGERIEYKNNNIKNKTYLQFFVSPCTKYDTIYFN